MSKGINIVINDKKYILTGLFLKACYSLNLSLEELYIIIYLENDFEKIFNPHKIHEDLGIPENKILESFNNLITKGIISLKSGHDLEGRIIENLELNGVNQLIGDLIENNTKEEQSSNVYQMFETEFGRTISPMEYEIINAWLNSNIAEELILEALKEAVYNGAKSFRYIDKILFDWNSKGFKTKEDIKNYLTTRKSSKEKIELFDYNWLEDEEE